MTQPPGYGPHGEHPEYLPPEPAPAPPPAWSDAAETAVLPPVPPYPAWSPAQAPPTQSTQPQQAPWDWQALSGHDLHGPPETPVPGWHQAAPGHPSAPDGTGHDPLSQATHPDTPWPSAPFPPQTPHPGPPLDWHQQQAPAGAPPQAPHPDASPDWHQQQAAHPEATAGWHPQAPGDQPQHTTPDSTPPSTPFAPQAPHPDASPDWHQQTPGAGWGGVSVTPDAPGAAAQRPTPGGRRRRTGQHDDWPGASAEAGPQAAAAAPGALFRDETPPPPQAPAGPDSAAFAAYAGAEAPPYAPAEGHRHAAQPVGGPWYPGATDPGPAPGADWPEERGPAAPPPAADRTLPPPTPPPAAWPEAQGGPAPTTSGPEAPRYSGHAEAPYSAAPSAASADPTSSAARRALGGSPIIDPGPEAAAITALGALALAFAAMGPRPLLGLVGAALQALTAAGWFRLNGMWPARQGIALAALGGFTASAAALALSGTSGAAAALTGTLGGFFALVLVLQLVRPADPAERFSALTVTASATVAAVLGGGWLAAAPLHASGAVVTVGALSAGLATLVAAGARLGPSAAMVAGFVAALVAGGAAGSLTGLGATAGVALGAAAGGAALVGRRVAAYDFPSRFVHLTAGVALPLALAAPATFLVGLLVG